MPFNLLSMTNNSAQDGFALTETLMAIVVASIAAIGFAHILSDQSRRAHAQKEHIAKYELAFSKIDLHSDRAIRSIDEISGVDEKMNLSWKVVAQKRDEFRVDNSEQPQLYDVIVTISNNQGEEVLKLSRIDIGPQDND